jgi:hypothetical protein
MLDHATASHRHDRGKHPVLVPRRREAEVLAEIGGASTLDVEQARRLAVLVFDDASTLRPGGSKRSRE